MKAIRIYVLIMIGVILGSFIGSFLSTYALGAGYVPGLRLVRVAP